MRQHPASPTSTPIHRLKKQARELARQQNIRLHEALDRVAQQQGYRRWSLLMAKSTLDQKNQPRFDPGELILVGARPRQGKTTFFFEALWQAMQRGAQTALFSLEYTHTDVLNHFVQLNLSPADYADHFVFHDSDHICADYIIRALDTFPSGSLVVIDYLQLLDQRRNHPALADQIYALNTFARQRKITMLIISQIDRRYDPDTAACPTLDHVRLPNPVDLSLFSQACFMHAGEVQFTTPA